MLLKLFVDNTRKVKTNRYAPPLTFTFADKHSGCYGNGLIDVTEKFEFGACSIWIVEHVGRGSFLFPTDLGRSKETLFAGYSTSRLTGETEEGIRHFHIDHDASVVQLLKICLTIVFNFSWVLQYYSRPERNRRQWLCKILGGRPVMAYVKMVNAGITKRA